MRVFPFLLTSIAFAGCAASAGRVESGAGSMLSSAAMQVKRCYRAPRVSHAGRQIATTIRVRMTSEGYPDGLPMVVSQEGVNASNITFADRMAEAAIGAIVRCSPLRLPRELYQHGWQEFDLTFAPAAAA